MAAYNDIGAACMSGGPAFVERDSTISFVGLYTGLLYPDREPAASAVATAGCWPLGQVKSKRNINHTLLF